MRREGATRNSWVSRHFGYETLRGRGRDPSTGTGRSWGLSRHQAVKSQVGSCDGWAALEIRRPMRKATAKRLDARPT